MTQLDMYAPVLTIGTVARELGVSAQAVRLYEGEGLVLPEKTNTGRRMFSIHDVERLRCIRTMITEHGLNIAGIRRLMALIPCWDYKGGLDEDCRQCPVYYEMLGPCWSVENVGPKCSGMNCRDCEVYRMPVSCEQMKNIVHRRGQFSNESS